MKDISILQARVYGHILACLDKVGQEICQFSGMMQLYIFFFQCRFSNYILILKLTLKLLDNFLSTVFLDTKINLNTPLYFLFHLCWEKIQVANNQGNLVLFHLRRSRE